jgi:predicted HicB family RNase H-like nuclease
MKLVQLTEETHKAVKVLAVNQGISLKDLVERLLKSAMKGAVK